MNIYKILKNWCLFIPELECSPYDCISYLRDNEKKSLYYIDKLPLSVGIENAYKLDDVDILYEQVIRGKASKHDFVQTEIKYINTISKLWIYNKTFVEFVLPDLYIEKPNFIVDNKYKKYLTILDDSRKTSNLLEIKKKDELEFWLQLGIRDAISVAFYLEDYKAIIVPSWSCFIMYLHDIKYYQIIKDIVISEGLFLRHQL